MTTNNELLQRVRTEIHEPSTVVNPRRTDAEILQWLQDGQLDYCSRMPQENFPELTTSLTFSGSSVALPASYMFFHSCTVTHTLSGTYTGIDECFVIGPGDAYLVNNYPGYMGAWAQITGDRITCGPHVYSGTLTYVRHPSTISSTSGTFDPGAEHEAAVVQYAASMALLKVNDDSARSHMELYFEAIESKGGRGESKEIERA